MSIVRHDSEILRLKKIVKDIQGTIITYPFPNHFLIILLSLETLKTAESAWIGVGAAILLYILLLI